ncbi:MAG: serine/threonine protein kinase [Planctomycetes bacterium]|nr:serine/threonine protein kinase [Planctomycetota bacterium]MCC7172146.1 serine/threonine protein kinase [Planctomycetota bacterium]
MTHVDEPAAGDGAAEAPIREGPGAHIGPYRLIRELGEGGFGVVFLAEQEKPVARSVALKIIKLGMDTHQVVARFEQERQALALMDHPNIARVIDAGATDTGRPYFVMDLVPGVPIVEYCDEHKLTVRERLALLEQVCNAVQHAHGKGIIHRDIKPSNILVATQDGVPHAKVIDFGIAKATSSKLAEKTVLTEHQQVIGTLQYMSPEQAEGSLDIDTRTDVYALGVLLYELLTGTPPIDLKTLHSAMLDELQRLIREVDPPRPSTRLAQATDTLREVAAQRSVDPTRLAPLVRGEIDWIVMKALEKDRARRYESASALALDLRRYLAGDAVLAAPPSAMYRFAKFVGRNKVVVASGAAIAAALLVGAIGFAWQAAIAGHQRDRAIAASDAESKARGIADEQRQIAVSNVRKASAINQFLIDMLGSANLLGLGRDAKVSQSLDRAAAMVGTAFREQPDVEAAIRALLGSTYESLGMFDAAEPQLEAALELYARLQGEVTVEYAIVLRDLASVYLERHEYAHAESTFARAADLAERAAGPDDRATLGARTGYANALVGLGRIDEAESMLRDLLEMRTRVQGRDAHDTQVTLNSLAVVLQHAQKLEEAEALYHEAAEIGARASGPIHPNTLTARFNAAHLMMQRGRLDEAEPLLASTYADIAQVFGESHVRTATAAQILADLHDQRGRYDQAIPLYESAIAIRGRAGPDDVKSLALAKSSLARSVQRAGDGPRAIALHREALESFLASEGPQGVNTLITRMNLANGLAQNGGMDEAATLFERLIDDLRSVLGADHPETIIATNSYAFLLNNLGRPAEAEPFVRAALESGRRVAGEDHPDTIITQNNLSNTLRRQGRLDEAETVGRDTVLRFVRVFGPRHPNTGIVRNGYAMTLLLLKRTDDAIAQLLEVVAISKATFGTEEGKFVPDAIVLGRALIDVGRLDEAKTVLDEVVLVVEKKRGPTHVAVAGARLELGRLLAAQSRFADAEPVLIEAQALLAESDPTVNEQTRRAVRYVAEFYAAWNAAEPTAVRAAKAEEWKGRVEEADGR